MHSWKIIIVFVVVYHGRTYDDGALFVGKAAQQRTRWSEEERKTPAGHTKQRSPFEDCTGIHKRHRVLEASSLWGPRLSQLNTGRPLILRSGEEGRPEEGAAPEEIRSVWRPLGED